MPGLSLLAKYPMPPTASRIPSPAEALPWQEMPCSAEQQLPNAPTKDVHRRAPKGVLGGAERGPREQGRVPVAAADAGNCMWGDREGDALRAWRPRKAGERQRGVITGLCLSSFLLRR